MYAIIGENLEYAEKNTREKIKYFVYKKAPVIYGYTRKGFSLAQG